MRIVKVRRRSTAHYQRMRLPSSGADWTARLPKLEADSTPAECHTGKHHLARIYDRQEQLDTMNVHWMQRTLESVSLSAEDWRLDRLPRSSVSPAAAGVSTMNDHQLRQLARDQKIRERRWGRHPRLQRLQQQQQHQRALKLATKNTPEAQISPADTASPLSIRGMLSGSDGAPQRTPTLDKPRQQQQHPAAVSAFLPPLLIQHQQQLPPRRVVAARDQQQHQQQHQQLQQHQQQQQTIPAGRQQRLRRQQPRRLGGHQRDRKQSGDTAAADLHYVSIGGPVARHLSVRWPTPVMEDEHQLQQQPPASSTSDGDGEVARQLVLNSEVTLFQPRNPVNSPEPS